MITEDDMNWLGGLARWGVGDDDLRDCMFSIDCLLANHKLTEHQEKRFRKLWWKLYGIVECAQALERGSTKYSGGQSLKPKTESESPYTDALRKSIEDRNGE